MKLSNSIGWCDDTTNAVTGCDKVSPGCKNCYAAVGTRARVLRAQGIETWGPHGVRHPVAQFAEKIRHLNKLCLCDRCHTPAPYATHIGKRCIACASQLSTLASQPIYRRIRLFADSNSDWLDDKWPIETLANFLDAIRHAPNVDVLLLTKRPEKWSERLHLAMRAIHNETDEWISGWLDGCPPPGVWLGVSVENQKYADERIPEILKIPAAVRFLSCEPLLERLKLTAHCPLPIYTHRGRPCCIEADGYHKYNGPCEPCGIDWVIIGGESGKGRRDCGVETIIDTARQFETAGVPVYVKQDSAFKSGQQGRIPDEIWSKKQFPQPHLTQRRQGATPP